MKTNKQFKERSEVKSGLWRQCSILMLLLVLLNMYLFIFLQCKCLYSHTLMTIMTFSPQLALCLHWNDPGRNCYHLCEWIGEKLMVTRLLWTQQQRLTPILESIVVQQLLCANVWCVLDSFKNKQKIAMNFDQIIIILFDTLFMYIICDLKSSIVSKQILRNERNFF